MVLPHGPPDLVQGVGLCLVGSHDMVSLWGFGKDSQGALLCGLVMGLHGRNSLLCRCAPTPGPHLCPGHHMDLFAQLQQLKHENYPSTPLAG